MRRVQIVILSVMLMSLVGCSKLFSGGKGKGDGEGNIPLAEAGGVLRDVNFDFDSSALSAGAQDTLRRNGDWLKSNSSAKAVIEGHCDERGTAEYNLALGERRARSAFDFLRSNGVKADQLSTISYGEELPLDQGHDESAWEKNRRAHFTIKQ